MSNENLNAPIFAISPSSSERVIYADGFARLSVKRGIAFLEFYQEAEADGRIVTHKIAMPLSGLGELSQSIAAFEKEMRSRQENPKTDNVVG